MVFGHLGSARDKSRMRSDQDEKSLLSTSSCGITLALILGRGLGGRSGAPWRETQDRAGQADLDTTFQHE